MPNCVKINVGKTYNVHIGAGLLDASGELIKEICPGSRVAIITDTNVAPLYAKRVEASLQKAGIGCSTYVFPAGEANKRINTVSDILEWLVQEGFSRTDVVAALGGGVVGDMAGFAAAVYLRGIKYVQLPTTLLAAVDSSVGGKTGVDLAGGKNLAGAFKQPEVVICDTDTLKTLPAHEIADGMAETIKYGVLFSEELFAALEQGAPEDMTDIITQCVALKGYIVEIDETEQNQRKLLNLGHTIGHAVEKCSNFSVTHGHAVAIGMAMIARAGEKMGITRAGTAARVEKCLRSHNLPTDCEYDAQSLANAAMADKKRSGSSITLVLAEKIGSCVLKKEPVSQLIAYTEQGRA